MLSCPDPSYAERAYSIHRALERCGSFVLLEADREYCSTLAHKLALAGILPSFSMFMSLAIVKLITVVSSLFSSCLTGLTVTVSPASQLNTHEIAAGSNPNLCRDEEPGQSINGHVASALTSEYIAFARFLLDPARSSIQWASSLSSCLTDSLVNGGASLTTATTSGDDDKDARNSRMVMGALCVLGGFTETVRSGALVRVESAGDSSRPLAVVINHSESHSHVVLTSELAQRSASTSVTCQRLKSPDLSPVPEYTVDLSHYPLSMPIFTALKDLVDVKIAERKLDGSSSLAHSMAMKRAWVLSEVKWRAVNVLQSLLISSATNTLDENMSTMIGNLLLDLAATCPLGFHLEVVSSQGNTLKKEGTSAVDIILILSV
jgi:hypothetical protein